MWATVVFVLMIVNTAVGLSRSQSSKSRRIEFAVLLSLELLLLPFFLVQTYEVFKVADGLT